MTKYNTPRENDLGYIIGQLRDRISNLERFSSTTRTHVTSPVKMADFNVPVAVTSGSFVDTHIFNGIFLAATPVVHLLATCTDGSTVGEFRLVDFSGSVFTDFNGDAVSATSIPTGTTTATEFWNNATLNYYRNLEVGSDGTVKLQVRRTAGSGTINIQAKYLAQLPG